MPRSGLAFCRIVFQVLKRVDGGRLGRVFFQRDTPGVARELLGAILWRRCDTRILAGRIVETEAYLSENDDASHAAWSKRGRGIMVGTPGVVYMYRAYGIHNMFNIVTESPGVPGAVLVRALEPVAGIQEMIGRRNTESLQNLCSGPGKLCQALDLTLDLTETDVTVDPNLFVTSGFAPARVRTGPRIGISRSVELPLRYFIAENAHVSAHRRGVQLP